MNKDKILIAIAIILGMVSLLCLCSMTSDAGRFSPDEIDAMAEKDLRASNYEESLNTSAMWKAYCEKYKVDSLNPSEQQVNYYLDCYCGNDDAERDALEYERNH